MKIKLLTARATVSGSENRGDIIDVSADEGERMIAAGQAEVVRGSKPEKATKKTMFERTAK